MISQNKALIVGWAVQARKSQKKQSEKINKKEKKQSLAN
jgi:hypothetical protein